MPNRRSVSFVGVMTAARLAPADFALTLLASAAFAHPFLVSFELAANVSAQTSSPDPGAAPILLVKGAVKQELRLAAADLKTMPRTKVTAKGHDGTTHEYEGVTLAALLAKAGAPQAGDLRGKSMSLCVVAEGSDGYRVAFSLEKSARAAGSANSNLSPSSTLPDKTSRDLSRRR